MAGVCDENMCRRSDRCYRDLNQPLFLPPPPFILNSYINQICTRSIIYSPYIITRSATICFWKSSKVNRVFIGSQIYWLNMLISFDLLIDTLIVSDYFYAEFSLEVKGASSIMFGDKNRGFEHIFKF